MLVGCGPSHKEKEEIAILTCNIMGESRNMDASLRIKEINAARKEIGEDRYLDTDENIKKSFEYGLCKELVLNDPNYDVLLKEKRLAAEEAQKKLLAEIEEKRLAREKILAEIEEKRLAEKELEAALKRWSKSCSDKIDENTLLVGSKVYETRCSGCHQANGEGLPPFYPALSNLNISSDEYIKIMLNGVRGTQKAPFGYLSDEQIASVISFNQNCWENEGEIVDPKEILKHRK